MTDANADGPLSGITVIALENYLAGNYGTQLMAMSGANVIKVERPGQGEALRKNAPLLGSGPRKRSHGELRLMNNKQSIALDLKKKDGVRVLMEIVKKCDVLWTNLKPSSLLKLGITYETLRAENPEIIYTTVSGFGHSDLLPEGPHSRYTAFDIIAQGLAGLQFRADGSDERPIYNGLALGDQVTSILAMNGTLMAIIACLKEKKPQRVDIAMYDAMIALNEKTIALHGIMGAIPPVGVSATSAPFGAYRTEDGWVNIAIGGDSVWRRFCSAIGREDLGSVPEYAEGFDRVKNSNSLNEIVAEWTQDRTTAEVVAELYDHSVPCAPLQDVDDVVRDHHAERREMLVDIGAQALDRRLLIAGNPIKMSGTTGRSPIPASSIGADTEDVLTELAGLSSSEIGDLRRDSVIE